MENNSSSVQTLQPTLGDGAVEGLLHGLIAGTIMAVYLAGYTLLVRAVPNNLLTRFAAALDAPAVTLVVGHFALAAFYGVVWGILYRSVLARFTWLPLWIWGILYGALLWSLSMVLLPVELGVTFLHVGVAHLIFGFMLGRLTK